MAAFSYTLFDTALGRCGLAWHETGIVAVSFPEKDHATTRLRLCRRAAEAQESNDLPAEIRQLITDIAALFDGGARDLSYAALDMAGIPEFDQAVYALSVEIKSGETKTYGDLARRLGDVSLSRRVGQSLGRNPFPIIVPCHRIVGADGAMTGFSAPGGTEIKRRLLEIEGALAPDLFDSLI